MDAREKITLCYHRNFSDHPQRNLLRALIRAFVLREINGKKGGAWHKRNRSLTKRHFQKFISAARGELCENPWPLQAFLFLSHFISHKIHTGSTAGLINSQAFCKSESGMWERIVRGHVGQNENQRVMHEKKGNQEKYKDFYQEN